MNKLLYLYTIFTSKLKDLELVIVGSSGYVLVS